MKNHKMFALLQTGILVYTDWGLRPHISIAGMDGSNHRMIVTHNLKWPNGVVIDRSVDRIFWQVSFVIFFQLKST